MVKSTILYIFRYRLYKTIGDGFLCGRASSRIVKATIFFQRYCEILTYLLRRRQYLELLVLNTSTEARVPRPPRGMLPSTVRPHTSTRIDYRHAMTVINYPALQADIIRCNRRLTAKLTRHEISPFCGNCESLTQFCKHLVYVTYVIIKLA